MLFVIEGCDRTGKSSLAQALIGDGPGEVIHWEKPSRSTAILEYVEPLMGYKPGEGYHLVCDRHYLGELVWPHVFGRRSLLTAADQECIELFLRDRGALCLLATREPRELEEACRDEPCAGSAARAQRMFQMEARVSMLDWWSWRHGDEPAHVIGAARNLEAEAACGLAHLW